MAQITLEEFYDMVSKEMIDELSLYPTETTDFFFGVKRHEMMYVKHALLLMKRLEKEGVKIKNLHAVVPQA